MAPRSRGIRSAFDLIAKTSSTETYVCRSCRHGTTKRSFASATAVAPSNAEEPPVEHNPASKPTTATATDPRITVKAGILLSRPPLVTSDLHPFETAYHLYQRRLNERLVLPFTQYFYYKRGTPAYEHWKTKRRERGGVATRDVGRYDAYSKDGWQDEALMNDESGQPQTIIENLIDEEGRAAEFVGEDGDAKLAGLKRTTAADEKQDQKSLERSLSSTLYLLVKSKGKGSRQEEKSLWRLPAGEIEDREGLKEAAQRVLYGSCGPNMNTWFVGNHPVGHYSETEGKKRLVKEKGKGDSSKEEALVPPVSGDSVKTFYMKARIMAGQADLKQPTQKYEDFKWLNKDEIHDHVEASYWAKIRHMLVAQ